MFVDWMTEIGNYSVLLTLVIIFLIFSFKPFFIFIPLPALFMVSSIIFSPFLALLINFIGVVLTFVSGYMIGVLIGNSSIADKIKRNKYAAKIIEANADKMLTVCFIYRLVPLQADVFNMYCGSIKLPFFKFLLFSFLGKAPSVTAYVIAGKYSNQPFTPQFLIPFTASTVLSSLFFYFYKKNLDKNSIAIAKN